MIAKVIRVEQGVKKEYPSGKTATVTEFEYQGLPYQGKERVSTTRSLFTNNPLHEKIVGFKPGQWVELKFDTDKYRSIIGIEGTSLPPESTSGQPSTSSGPQEEAYVGSVRLEGVTPKDRAITLQGCLKVVAQGLEKFKSLDELKSAGMELYEWVVEFANKVGEDTEKEDILMEIESKLMGLMPEPIDFWKWLVDKCPEIKDGSKEGGVNKLNLELGHAKYLLKNLDQKWADFKADTRDPDEGHQDRKDLVGQEEPEKTDGGPGDDIPF